MSTKDDSGNEDDGVECPTCGKEFNTERGMKVHHTKSHGESLIATQETCHWCEAEFTDTRNRNRESERRFCGQDCRREWLKTRTGEKHPRYNSSEVTCAHCGNALTRPEYRLREGKKHYCNQGCLAQWRSENLSGENSHLYSSVEVECWSCGGSVMKPPSHIDGREHFCSPRCVGAWLSSERAGENSPVWKGGHDNYYGPNWVPQRRKARDRDGHICQDPECSVTSDEHLEVWGEVLHVHHIVRFHDFDDYKEANRLSNLVTLCRPHHLGKWEHRPGERPDGFGE